MLGPKTTASAGTSKSSNSSLSGSATGNPRNKVALKPGHSLMDWIRLGNSGKDLTGVNGVLQEVTVAQLATHNKCTDAWVAIRGKVYNVTHYLDFHPGGQEELMRGVGKDATDLFNQVHAWVNYDSILQKCVVGRLKRDDNNEDLADHLFGKNRKKTDSIFLAPAAVPVSKTSSTPRTDWFQQLGSVTLAVYSRVTCPQVRVHLSEGRNLSVYVRLGMHRKFLAHHMLEGEVVWPCTVNLHGDSGKVEVQLLKVKSHLWAGLGSPFEDNSTIVKVPDVDETFLPMSLVGVESVTHNTKLLVLRHANDTCDTVPLGHHVLVRSEVEGVAVIRRYTPVPPALHQDFIPLSWRADCLCLMVKHYPLGALTPLLCDLQPGQSVTVSQPEGNFQPQTLSGCTHLYLVAAGTGLTPMLALIQWALARKCQKVNLMFLNRTQSDILWREQMDRVAQDDSRFSVVHVLSDAGADWPGPRGRMDLMLLQSFLPTTLPDPNSPASCFICVCGPTPFTELTHKLLQDMGYSESHYHCFLG